MDALASVVPALANLSWDFRLTTLNQFRGELLGSSAVSGPTRRELLTLALPRLLWQATASHANTLVVDVLFDATDITTGRYVRRVIVYDPKLDTVIRLAPHQERPSESCQTSS